MSDDDDWLKDIESGDSGRDGLERVRRVLTNREKVDPRPMPPQSAYEADAEPPAPHKPPEPIASFHSVSALADREIPPRAWLVPDLIPAGTVTLLTGDGGTGKSLIAAQLAVATCLGSTWMGYSVTPGAAVYISAEDDETELLRRLADIAKDEDVTFTDLDRLTISSLAGKSALLANLARNGALHPSRLMKEVEAVLEAERPVLLVLDTLADLFPGNENDRAQARQFIGLMRGLAMRYECAVLLLSHPSIEGMRSGSGTSGSTAWSNSVRSRLYFDRIKSDDFEADADARILRCLKSNYSRAGAEVKVRWREGVFKPDGAESGLDRAAAGARADRVFLKLLRLFTEQGRRVNSSGGSNYAPKVFAEHPDGEGVTKAALRVAMDKHLSAGRVQVVKAGSEKRPTTYLAEVEK